MRKVTTCLLALMLLVLSGLPVSAQKLVTGKVIDAETQKPLPGASVRAGDLRATVTGDGGLFSLRSVPENQTSITVSFVGYASVTVPVGKVSLQNPIALSKSIYSADEVVVNATRVGEKTAMAYTNVSAAAISKQNLGQDLPVLLNFTPSMVTTSDAGAGVGYTGMRIRGSDASRINVTINGIPYNDAESQGTYFVNMPDFASSVSSIQIQRGVGTSTNGAGAFGASVNINTNEFRREAYGEINSSFGSFNTLKNTVKVGTGLLNDKFTLDARLSKVTSNGFVDRGASDLNSFYVSGAYFGKKSFFRANLFSGKEKTYQSWNGVPEAKLNNNREGILAYIENNELNTRDANNLLNSNNRTYNSLWYDNEVDNYQQTQAQLISSHTLNSNWTLNVNAFYVRGKGYYEQYKDNAKLSNYLLPSVTIGSDTIKRSDVIRRRWLDNHFYGTTFSLDYNSPGKLSFNFGGGWNQYDGDHYGQLIWARYASTSEIRHRYYSGNGLKTDFNLYAKANYQINEKLNVYGDIQFRNVQHTIHGTDNDQKTLNADRKFQFFNPKAGINYQISEQSSVYASYSVGNREPNRNDIVDANPGVTPKAETLHDLEAGFRSSGSRWTFAANYFLMNYKNQLVLTGQINDVGSSIRVNVPKSYRTGIELEAGILLNDKWRWNGNVTLSQNKISDFTEYIIDYDTYEYKETNHGRTDISFSPNVVAGSQLSYFPIKNVELALLTKWVGKQYLDNTSNEARRLNAYVTNDIRVSWTLKPRWAKHIRINALVNNVLNELYESNGYTYGFISNGKQYQENFYFPQAGTNFLVGLSLAF